MTRRRRLLLAGIATVAVLAVVLVALLRPEPAAPALAAPFEIALSGPVRIGAGEPWIIDVDDPGQVDDGDAATVSILGPWGTRRFTATVEDGAVAVPGSIMTRSGAVSATVQVGTGTGTASVVVDPGGAVDGTTPLAGPRSMVADRTHWTMVTAIPRDRYGNVVADGSIVEIVVRRPDGSVEVVSTEVRDLLAAVRVFSTTVAGRSTVRVDADDTTGAEVDVLEVPGPPSPFGLTESGLPLRSDGRQLFVLTTDVLVDQYGNELLDGTAAIATIDTPTGRSTIRSVTIDGRAEFVVETPKEPGTVAVEVVVDGVRSERLELQVAPDVTAVPVAIDLTAGLLRIEVGPVLSGLGGYVPDGTKAAISIDGRTDTIVLASGVGVLELPWPSTGADDDAGLPTEVVVRVLGASRTVRP